MRPCVWSNYSLRCVNNNNNALHSLTAITIDRYCIESCKTYQMHFEKWRSPRIGNDDYAGVQYLYHIYCSPICLFNCRTMIKTTLGFFKYLLLIYAYIYIYYYISILKWHIGELHALFLLYGKTGISSAS